MFQLNISNIISRKKRYSYAFEFSFDSVYRLVECYRRIHACADMHQSHCIPIYIYSDFQSESVLNRVKTNSIQNKKQKTKNEE